MRQCSSCSCWFLMLNDSNIDQTKNKEDDVGPLLRFGDNRKPRRRTSCLHSAAADEKTPCLQHRTTSASQETRGRLTGSRASTHTPTHTTKSTLFILFYKLPICLFCLSIYTVFSDPIKSLIVFHALNYPVFPLSCFYENIFSLLAAPPSSFLVNSHRVVLQKTLWHVQINGVSKAPGRPPGFAECKPAGFSGSSDPAMLRKASEELSLCRDELRVKNKHGQRAE